MGSLTGILAIYGVIVMLTIVAQVLAAAQQLGLSTLAGNREGLGQLDGAAGRLDRAQMNSVIALALAAPAMLIHIVQGASGGGILLAAQIFLIARVVYVVVYAIGIPWVRTLSWLTAYAMVFWLYLMAL